jgi:hypothetical protein
MLQSSRYGCAIGVAQLECIGLSFHILKDFLVRLCVESKAFSSHEHMECVRKKQEDSSLYTQATQAEKAQEWKTVQSTR